MKFTITSEVKQGNLIRNRDTIQKAINSFESKEITLTIEKKKSKRSLDQNSLWWLYVTIIANELGYTKNELHEILKMKFCKAEKVIEKTGEVMPYLKSTTEYSKADFADLVNELIRWSAQELGIVLPMPGDQMTIEA